MHSTGSWRHAPQTFRKPRKLSILLMLTIGLCVAMACAIGAATVSKGIANLAHFNVNHGVDQ